MNEKIIVLDTETTNGLDNPLVYDIGFIVANKKGKIYERHSYVVSEIFLDYELMKEAYFVEKIPQYWEDIKNNKRKLRKLITIKMILKKVIEKYDIKEIYAFNCRFDYTSLTTTQRYFTSSKWRWFYPYQVEFMDIMKYAIEVLKNNQDYKRFCEKNNYLTNYGKNRHTAEIVYKYFFDNNFTEEHTGLEDCEIEYKILLQCFKMKRGYDCQLWQS